MPVQNSIGSILEQRAHKRGCALKELRSHSPEFSILSDMLFVFNESGCYAPICTKCLRQMNTISRGISGFNLERPG